MSADFSIKELFYDRKAVMGAVDKGVRAVLSKFGAFVRQRARSSIRKRKAVSRPGQPPASHAGMLKRLIFFGYDPGKRSVVIGPTPFGAGTAPELLEQEHVAGTTKKVRQKDTRGKTVTMTYKARPYMGPAFEQEKPNLPDLWRGSIG